MVVSRFAPSPTGDLHIGSIRTALYAWLYARQHNGKFILRIEDTDTQRSTKESIQGILDGMQWLNLDYDEGPIFQSERTVRYRQVAEQLISNGNAYKCYCTKERLDQLRERQLSDKQKPKYDGFCRMHVTKNSNSTNNFVIRFVTPLSGETNFNDRVRGLLKVNNKELDDLIIIRSDGTPTYNLSVVVDDLDMGINMVIRGDDHINNTFRQINIFKALNSKPPQYAHVSSILGPDGQKLSKRHGATSVIAYRDKGILPEALINALVRLGWSHGGQELFSIYEMISLFKIDDVHKSPAVFDLQKLYWFNQQYLKNMDDQILAEHLKYFLDKNDNLVFNNGPELFKVVNVLKSRCKDLVEMAAKAACFYVNTIEYNQEAVSKYFNSTTSDILQTVILELEKTGNTDWTADNFKLLVNNLLKDLNLKMPELAQPLRIALTGDVNSPSIHETLALIPKELAINRLKQALNFIKK